MTTEAGQVELVAGKYRLTRLLGRGGMGSVWEGVHCSLGTRVAVKFIEAEHVDSAEARSRFDNEARAAARLESKHVVKVFDHGVTDDGRPYMVMEYLSGEPLDQRLQRFGRLAPGEVATILGQVCRALTRAHEAGIIHRDLKPENVFLVHDDEDGTEIVKVVDFGIAKFTEKSAGLSSSTKTGAVLGTPYYMSPEQARGLRTVDARSDLWSVSVIAYRCLTGHLPFVGEAVGDLLVKICTSPIVPPSQLAPGLTPGLDAWFARALDREPSGRFQNAQELATSFVMACTVAVPNAPYRQELASAPTLAAPASHISNPLAAPTPRVEGVTAAPFTTHAAPAVRSKSRAALVVAVAASGLAVLVVGGLLLSRSGRASPTEETATSLPQAAAAPAASQSATPPAEPTVAPTTEPPPAASSAELPAAAPKPVGKVGPRVEPKTGAKGEPKPVTKPEAGSKKPPTTGDPLGY